MRGCQPGETGEGPSVVAWPPVAGEDKRGSQGRLAEFQSVFLNVEKSGQPLSYIHPRRKHCIYVDYSINDLCDKICIILSSIAPTIAKCRCQKAPFEG